jgi:hypothetical protein
MAEVLQLSLTTRLSASDLRWVANLVAPITIQAGMALEYQVRLGEGTPRSDGSQYLSEIRTNVSSFDLPDQNNFKDAGTPAQSIYLSAKERWVERIISLDSLIGQTLLGVDLRVGYGVVGSYKNQYANVRVTQFRQPIAYIWTAGMSIPLMSELVLYDPLPGPSTGISGAQICILDIHEHFPLDCTTPLSVDRHVDNVGVNRLSSGSIRRWIEWALRKDEFEVEFPAVTEMERQYAVAFYDVYRGGDDWFFWQHRRNYPAQKVVFNGPLDITPVLMRGGSETRYRIRAKFLEV